MYFIRIRFYFEALCIFRVLTMLLLTSLTMVLAFVDYRLFIKRERSVDTDPFK